MLVRKSMKTSDSNPQISGQALIETVLALTLATTAVAGSVGVLWAQWKRLQCTTHVFKKTHDLMTGGTTKEDMRRTDQDTIQYRSFETHTHFKGEAFCGKVKDEIMLPKLEPYQPR